MTQAQQDKTFLSGVNAEYIAHLYAQYLKNPSNVDESWRDFFGDLNDSEALLLKELSGASWTPDENTRSLRNFGSAAVAPADGILVEAANDAAAKGNKGGASQADIRQAALDSIRALMLIRSYRFRGHLLANIDPLGMKPIEEHPELDPAYHGFTDSDFDRPIFVNGVFGLESTTLRALIAVLKDVYCGTVGMEYRHLSNVEEREWIQERIENPENKVTFSHESKKVILERLTAAESFEQFLHKKHTGAKRFGIDGGEALIPAIEEIMKCGAELGLEEVIIGMAHRGRLNVLANVMGKPFRTIFAEFQGQSSTPDDVLGTGDVKYHLGTSSDREFNGKKIHLSLTANPSHLEFVNPVVIGKVRAKQVLRNDVQSTAVLPLLFHGDAAFAGQGIIAETFMISELPGYRVGGTLHIVINNQIGFTTMPKFSRSGPYCTDVAKMLDAPIFHVNGDDPEAVVYVTRLATEFRQKFKKDVVIDIFCYRRFGHNEGDEPAFTQPLMYKKIATQETARSKYADQLIGEGVIDEVESQKVQDDYIALLNEAFDAVESYKADSADYLEGAWEGLKVAYGDDRRGETDVPEKDIKRIGKVLTHVPDDFAINKKLQRIVGNKDKMLETGEGFDWAMAEALAFGSLLDDGYSIRLSGQDVGRGTFSHRHAIWYDQENEHKHVALQHIKPNQPKFEAHDSPLSEMAVLGFEYGYSLADPKTLTIWEAQFGDFANGAQVMIDQFISSGESKWLRMSGLVMLLPHGHEGQGPEHSSARFERFLQLSADDNWQICNCTTPANYFHVLRRQMHRDFRKPLIIMTPKSLLRHKLAVSEMYMFTEGSTFHRVLWDDDMDTLVKPEKMKRVVLCTGKVYFDLLEERRKRKLKDVIILRLEQIFPFPSEALGGELKQYKNADIVWCQEEPENQGAWTFVDRRIEKALADIKHKAGRPKYVGRTAAASPATGSNSRHHAEQAALVNDALSV
ncbi:MAG: 2-oxoglutarate dehydrogenase E1 component [Alphaproteobacteria bacterium]|nr:MAG: 2-oxoglutarate dehydrogenase E1 component [Alphaproteobacteria bacterium]